MSVIKHALLVTAVFLAGPCLAGDTIRLSEPVEATAEYETFGSPHDDAVPLVSLERVADGDESLVGETVSVVTQVKEVCQKKGCFFIAVNLPVASPSTEPSAEISIGPASMRTRSRRLLPRRGSSNA